VDPDYYETYYKNVENYVAQCGGVLHERKYSEYSRVILALTAIGKDPTNVAGYDLTKPLSNFDQTCFQGINGPMFALIALDSGGYDVPIAESGVTQASKDMYLDLLLEKQLENGGWCLTGDQMETDMTSMALQALSNYRDREPVAQAVERGLEALSAAQNADGSFATNDGTSCESVAQAIVALAELGIPLDDPRFVKDGRTLMDRLMDYRMPDGGFCHLIGEETNQMATEQAFYAMVAARRLEEGHSALYDMNEVE
ncbi:MAG: terpene cyclase/mutase family protein, partial [Clostridia bacterium]|nr:terpene cyclase/mutase family protein [Clostridia bacterium]